MIGFFENAFVNSNLLNNKLQLQFYNKPLIKLIGYDATIEGGLFNQENPYEISSRNIDRFTFEDDAGITFQFKKIYLEYFQHFVTQEFNTGTYHRWGGIRRGIAF